MTYIFATNSFNYFEFYFPAWSLVLKLWNSSQQFSAVGQMIASVAVSTNYDKHRLIYSNFIENINF